VYAMAGLWRHWRMLAWARCALADRVIGWPHPSRRRSSNLHELWRRPVEL
jgi:hypothetical protein